MKKIIASILLAAMLLVAGCGNASGIKAMEDLNGKTIAVPSGTATEELVATQVADATYAYYGSAQECVQAVADGHADAAAYDKPVMQNIASQTDGVKLLDDVISEDNYAYAVHINNAELKTQIDEFLNEIKANGVYEEMTDRWFPENGTPGDMPVIEPGSGNGILYFGTSTVVPPFSYLDANGNYAGFDIEFAQRLAQKLGRQLEIVDMEYGSLVPEVMAQNINMAGACLTVTEEISQLVSLSTPYLSGGVALVIAK